MNNNKKSNFKVEGSFEIYERRRSLVQDEKIIELYFSRDERAVYETQKKYGKYLNTIAYNVLSSSEDAEECENDTYLAAWQAIPPARPESLAAYLGGTARKIALNLLRRRSADKRGGGECDVCLHELEECLPDREPEERVRSEELTAALNAFLQTLGERERTVFVCRYWYCCSVADVAERFSLKENTVKSILRRTRVKLRRFLRKENIEL